jgi:hypothetical protein
MQINLDVRPNVTGIQNMQRLLALGNPKVGGVKANSVVYNAVVERVQTTKFYEDLVARAKK